jgi:hypothetical protein
VKPPVTREQRARWLGHVVDHSNRMTDAYEKFDPEYLWDCAQATEVIIAQLQEHTTRALDARKLRARAPLRVVGGIDIDGQVMETAMENGGRDRDRTCDPYGVNVVLSR